MSTRKGEAPYRASTSGSSSSPRKRSIRSAPPAVGNARRSSPPLRSGGVRSRVRSVVLGTATTSAGGIRPWSARNRTMPVVWWKCASPSSRTMIGIGPRRAPAGW